MKEQILKLRAEGKSYRAIEKIVGCSRSLVSYYINPMGKQKNQERCNKNRFRRRKEYKMLSGGKCCNCGYCKCIDALQFHHLDSSKKSFNVTDAIFSKNGTYTDDQIKKEIQKCILICANCHFELHAKNTFID